MTARVIQIRSAIGQTACRTIRTSFVFIDSSIYLISGRQAGPLAPEVCTWPTTWGRWAALLHVTDRFLKLVDPFLTNKKASFLIAKNSAPGPDPIDSSVPWLQLIDFWIPFR